MITRKKIDLEIHTNSPEQFVRLGNLFSNNSLINTIFVPSLPIEMSYFLQTISNDNIDIFIQQYVYKNRLKTLSNFITNIIDTYGLKGYQIQNNGNTYLVYSLSEKELRTVSVLIENTYLNKWKKLQSTLNFEYNPIKPYDMTTKEKIGEKQGGTTSNSGSIDDSGSDTTTSKVILDKTEDSLYGFNSLEPVPSNKTENSSENLDSSESKNKSTSSNTTIHGRTNDIDRELSRTGNIGNITQQELIKQERDVVQYIIWNTIYDDLNRVFTRSKYIY